ncbi:NADH dehydrogenase [ubiquinone] 1 alpha subcomplex assembly factor 3 [Onthophagus taurus]|uniref:NADH dehydrogenase [ubiquinone] 1 alpha subcomplex assembly factor 3 n=1 Tax=Onthophagus taurus TaxID=166361 RepID=UPI000C1FF44D|nr:NADH dehydrogenase [ubiquinone] 1 alpha subcomplex assembly factor 3 [Onthophagus taurus]
MVMLRNICNKLIKQTSLFQQSKRFLKVSPTLKSFDGEGKTSVNILNQEEGANLMINGFSQAGFRLNNDLTVLGPIAIFPRTILAWNVSGIDDITEESLQLFTVLEPKLDILVIGVGDKLDDLSFHRRFLPFMHKHKINLEILPTEQACSTFNFMSSEGRYVGGAMIPPTNISAPEDDVLASKMRYQNLYEFE